MCREIVSIYHDRHPWSPTSVGSLFISKESRFMGRYLHKPGLVMCCLLAGFASSWHLPSHASPSPEPVQLIEQFARDLLKSLEANRATYRQDAAPLRKMVDQYLRPNFDAEFAAQRVLGQQWNNADAAQRGRFLEAFYQSVLQSYSQAILELTAEQLIPLPFRPDDNPELAEVRYEVRKDKVPPLPVSYLLRRSGGGWKIWDLKIEGLSYTKAYQFRLTGDVQKLGLDGAIQRLETQVGIAAPMAPAAGAR
jgi:phospholipid transport system substrate-binding protein